LIINIVFISRFKNFAKLNNIVNFAPFFVKNSSPEDEII